MNQGLPLLTPDFPVDMRTAEPRLLLELEPRHRVFFRNLIDLIWPQRQRPLLFPSRPIPVRRDLFVQPGVRWPVVAESIGWHFALLPLVLTLWILSSRFELHRYPARQANTSWEQAHVTYYPPTAYPARAGSQGREAAPLPKGTPRAVIPVSEEGGGSEPDAPPVEWASAIEPELPGSSPTLPSVPISATTRERLELPASEVVAVGPQPRLNRASSRGLKMPEASVVAPAPRIAGLRGLPGVPAPLALVVAPAPALAGKLSVRSSGGDINIGPSRVVMPSPQLPMREQRAGRGGSANPFGGAGDTVVAPAPSLAGMPGHGSGRGTALGGAGDQVVPPAPALDAAEIGVGNGPGDSFAGLGTQPVPPAPSIAGSGSLASGRGNTQGGIGLAAVGPAPTLSGAGLGSGGHGTGTGGTQFASLDVEPARPGSWTGKPGGSGGTGDGPGGSGTGLAGSGSGTGGLGGHTTGEASGGGSQPGSSASGTTHSTELASTLPATSPPVNTSAPVVRDAVPPPLHKVIDDPGGTTKVVPLRLIQLALALPTTSYFSNYEAFVAERALNDHATQVIKLVYIFLPYQRRLTEYGVNTSKTFKLRVTRDPSCDESLLSMTWPEAKQDTDEAGNSSDSGSKLPCYRTTADDYRKALEAAH